MKQARKRAYRQLLSHAPHLESLVLERWEWDHPERSIPLTSILRHISSSSLHTLQVTLEDYDCVPDLITKCQGLFHNVRDLALSVHYWVGNDVERFISSFDSLRNFRASGLEPFDLSCLEKHAPTLETLGIDCYCPDFSYWETSLAKFRALIRLMKRLERLDLQMPDLSEADAREDKWGLFGEVLVRFLRSMVYLAAYD